MRTNEMEAGMFARGVKLTFTNELMKQSITDYMIKNFDLKGGMIMSFKIHLAENQVLHIGVFPDEETANAQSEKVKDARKQISAMGAKAEDMSGSISDLLIAGDVTLNQLTSNR